MKNQDMSIFGDRAPKDTSPEHLVIFLYQECSRLLSLVECQKARIKYVEEGNATLASQRNKALRELRILMDAFNKVSEKEPESADIDNICQ